ARFLVEGNRAALVDESRYVLHGYRGSSEEDRADSTPNGCALRSPWRLRSVGATCLVGRELHCSGADITPPPSRTPTAAPPVAAPCSWPSPACPVDSRIYGGCV